METPEGGDEGGGWGAAEAGRGQRGRMEDHERILLCEERDVGKGEVKLKKTKFSRWLSNSIRGCHEIR